MCLSNVFFLFKVHKARPADLAQTVPPVKTDSQEDPVHLASLERMEHQALPVFQVRLMTCFLTESHFLSWNL